MIQVSPELRAALFAASNEPVDLYELYLDTGTLYYADQAIVWGGHAYSAQVKSRSAIQRFCDGEFDRVTVTFSNVDRALADVVLNNEIEGRRLIIRKIDRGVANDSIVLFNGEMERPSRISEETCAIEAKQIVGSIEQEVPARLFGFFCPFNPGEWECGLPAGTSCDKSWSRCSELANSAQFGGFRFVPHSGTYQYRETESKRTWYTLGLWKRKKTKTVTGTFSAVDDTPYDVPIPIIYGRQQITGIDIQHADEGGVTKVLSAFCVGKISDIFHLRANEAAVLDYTLHYGDRGALNTVDPRFPNSYPYSLVAFAGVTVPSDVREVDPAPQITALILGRGVSHFGPGGVFDHWGWSDNPVWCVRDFMTLPVAQGGLGVPDDWFDDAVNYQEAAYCDEVITDTTNDQKIYNPTNLPSGVAYKRYRSTGIDGGDPAVDGPYDDYEPGVDDDTSRNPAPVDVKRFTLNVAIAKTEKAIDVLFKKLLPAFRGYITFSKDGKIQIRVERPVPHTTAGQASAPGALEILCAPPAGIAAGDLILASPLTASAEVLTVAAVLADRIQFTTAAAYAHALGDELLKVAMAFTDASIVGGFEYPLSDRQPSTNRVTIKYVDAPAGFEPRELRINDFEHQAKVHKVNNEDLDGSAIDSYFQAWRIGQWRRAKVRDLGKFCTFRADIKSTLLEIGDVVAVSASEVGLQAAPFRAIELAFEEDDEVTVTGQLYSTAVYDDTAPQTTVTVPTIFDQPVGAPQEIPGDVQPIGTDAFLLTQQEDGVNCACDIEYDPPATIGAFAGVTAHWVPDGTSIPALAVDFDYNGNPAAPAGTAERRGKCRFVIPQPLDANAPGRVYLTSRTKSYKKTLVLFGQPGASPSRAITITKAVGGADPGAAPNVQGTTAANVWYKDNQVGQGRVFGFEGTIVPPADTSNFSACRVYLHWITGWNGPDPIYDDGLGYQDIWLQSGPDGGFWHANEPGFPLDPGRDQYVDLLFVPWNRHGVENADKSACFSIRLRVQESGAQTPDNPVGSTAQINYTHIPDKGWHFGFSGTVVPPADTTNYAGTKVFIKWDTFPEYTELWNTRAGGLNWKSGTFPLDPGSLGLKIIFCAYNQRDEKVPFASAPFVYLTKSDQAVQYAPNPDAATTAAVGYAQRDGEWYFYFYGTLANPADTSNYAACKIVFHCEDWPADHFQELQQIPLGVNQWRTPEYKLPDGWTRWYDVIFVPINKHGQQTASYQSGPPYTGLLVIRVTVTATGHQSYVQANRLDPATVGGGLVLGGGQLAFNPGAGMEIVGSAAGVKILSSQGLQVNGSNQLAVKATWGVTFDASGNLIINADANDFDQVYGYLRQKRVDLAKAANFDTGQFKLESGAFKVNQLSANLIVLGTYNVGGGANMPGQMAVYGSSGLVGWIGQNGAYYGGAFKQLYVGYTGSDVSTAKLIADGVGNLSILNASISITQAGVGTLTISPLEGLKWASASNPSTVYTVLGPLDWNSSWKQPALDPIHAEPSGVYMGKYYVRASVVDWSVYIGPKIAQYFLARRYPGLWSKFSMINFGMASARFAKFGWNATNHYVSP